MEATKQVVFKVGNEEYGLDILIVSDIEAFSDVVAVPNASDYILGILNLRGEVIPVFSLRVKFGMKEEDFPNQKLIITKINDMSIGFKVDCVEGIFEFPEDALNEIPLIVKTDKTKYVKKVATQNGKLILLLDHYGILDEKELGLAKEAIEVK